MKGGLDGASTDRQYDIWLKSVESLASCDPAVVSLLISKAVRVTAFCIEIKCVPLVPLAVLFEAFHHYEVQHNKRVMHET
jgi:hypothetical protein